MVEVKWRYKIYVIINNCFKCIVSLDYHYVNKESHYCEKLLEKNIFPDPLCLNLSPPYILDFNLLFFCQPQNNADKLSQNVTCVPHPHSKSL